MKKTLSTLILCALLWPFPAAAQDTPATVKFPSALDSADSLIRASNSARSTLTAGVTNSATTIPVASAASFPASGAAMIDNEIVFYTGKTSNSLTGAVRSADSTVAASHSSGAAVRGVITAAHHNTLAFAVIQAETKIGAGASGPLSGTFLKGTGAGVSGWEALTSADIPALPESRITNLTTDLAGKAATSHTHTLESITGAGTMAAQNASGVNITGGVISNVICTACVGSVSGTGGVSNADSTSIQAANESTSDVDGFITFGTRTRTVWRRFFFPRGRGRSL